MQLLNWSKMVQHWVQSNSNIFLKETKALPTVLLTGNQSQCDHHADGNDIYIKYRNAVLDLVRIFMQVLLLINVSQSSSCTRSGDQWIMDQSHEKTENLPLSCQSSSIIKRFHQMDFVNVVFGNLFPALLDCCWLRQTVKLNEGWERDARSSPKLSVDWMMHR